MEFCMPIPSLRGCFDNKKLLSLVCKSLVTDMFRRSYFLRLEAEFILSITRKPTEVFWGFFRYLSNILSWFFINLMASCYAFSSCLLLYALSSRNPEWSCGRFIFIWPLFGKFWKGAFEFTGWNYECRFGLCESVELLLRGLRCLKRVLLWTSWAEERVGDFLAPSWWVRLLPTAR